MHCLDEFVVSIEEQKVKVSSMMAEIRKPFAIWGDSAKGVTFVNTLSTSLQERLSFLVDINKGKQGKYCPGTGHRIVSPVALRQKREIQDIIVMNPNYHVEIEELLRGYRRDFNLICI